MGNRRRVKPLKADRCDRCHRVATHVVVIPAEAADDGLPHELVACDRHFETLQLVLAGFGASVSGCLTGCCS
jgi:hypothetical protein